MKINIFSSAFVLFGDNINDDSINFAINFCKEKFVFPNKKFFYSKEKTNSWKNLYFGSNIKRDYEIENKIEFDVVVGINVNEIDNIVDIEIKKIECLDNFVYYFNGYTDQYSKIYIKNHGFYASSRIFDMISRFYEKKDHFKGSIFIEKFLKNFDEHYFYFFIKTLSCKTTCILPNKFETKKND